MKKRILSLALALVLCLGLTVPAFAAEDTEKTYTGECELGKVSVIMNGWLRTEYVPTRYDPIANDSVSEADTVLAIHVVEDGSTVKIEPLDFELNALNEEYYRWGDGIWLSYIPAFGFAGGGMGSNDTEGKTFTASPAAEGEDFLMDASFGVFWMCESDFAKIKSEHKVSSSGRTVIGAVDPAGGTEAQPPPPTPTPVATHPLTPDPPGTYTVKKWDTWSIICTNFYGTNAQRYALMKANKSVKLTEGTILTLPEKLGKDTLIPAPVCAEGEKLYTVKAGDTLGKIALAEYGSMAQYKAIFERNSDRLANANLIYEGQIIVLPVISK